MTPMTLMTLNLGYGIGISSKQRHKRHQRHYRHANRLPGVWGTPQKCVCGYPNAMLAKHVPPKAGAIKSDTHTNSYMFQSESLLIHPKILTRKSESVLIHFRIYVRYIANAKFICVQPPPTPRHGLWRVRKDG